MPGEVQFAVGIIKDVIIAVAAIVTSSVAIIGLNKWRHELRGKTEYELARRLIKALYKVRDGFNGVRSPFIMASEYPQGSGGAPESETKNATLYVYQNRWNYLTEALSDLESEVLEAEVIWGEEVEKLMQGIRSCRAELQIAIQQYLANVGRIHDNPEHARKMMEKVCNFDDSADPFSVRITDAVRALERKVRQHLKH